MSPRPYRLGERQSQVERTRERVLRAALKLFPSKGVHNVSIEAVAAAAGVSRGIVYHHFGSKRGLIDAMNMNLMQKAGLEHVWQAAQHPDAVTGLRDFFRENCKFLSATASAIHIGRYLSLSDVDARRSFVASYVTARKVFLASVIDRLGGQGRLDPQWARDDAIDVLMVLTGAEAYESVVVFAKRSLDEGAETLFRMASVLLNK